MSYPIRPNGRYEVNEGFFKELTPESTYVLGYLYADGCNYVPEGKIRMQLHESDHQLLEDIKKAIGSDHPIKPAPISKASWCPTSRQVKMIVGSTEMSRDLVELGCVQKKSKILTYPNFMRGHPYERHFVRGYYDGDGCLYFSKSNNQMRIIIVSTKMFCNALKEVFQTIGIRSHVSITSSGRSHHVRFGGNKQVRRFADWIYPESTIWLHRKRDKYQRIIKERYGE
jgi:hypothetical protein